MTVPETLHEIKMHAKKDKDFREALIATRDGDNSVTNFCRICTEAGFELSAMDLVMHGEEFYAAIRRSTNGGGENSPALDGEDDFYEMFLVALEEYED